MTTGDEVEHHIARLRQRIAALTSDPSSPPTATAAARTALTTELGLAQSRLSAIQANGRYLALLSCGALLVVVLVFLLAGWQSPIVHLHGLMNSASRERMARLGVTENMLDARGDDRSFASAFDWWSWLVQDDSASNKQHT